MQSPLAKQAILEVVANQLRAGNPPETRATYERLKSAGFSEKEVRDLIGQVVASEIFDVVRKSEKYDHERFVARLSQLPEEP